MRANRQFERRSWLSKDERVCRAFLRQLSPFVGRPLAGHNLENLHQVRAEIETIARSYLELQNILRLISKLSREVQSRAEADIPKSLPGSPIGFQLVKDLRDFLEPFKNVLTDSTSVRIADWKLRQWQWTEQTHSVPLYDGYNLHPVEFREDHTHTLIFPPAESWRSFEGCRLFGFVGCGGETFSCYLRLGSDANRAVVDQNADTSCPSCRGVGSTKLDP